MGLSDWLPISNYPRDLGPELHRDEQVTKYRPYLTSIGVVAGGLKIAVEEVPSRLAGQDLAPGLPVMSGSAAIYGKTRSASFGDVTSTCAIISYSLPIH